MHESVQHTLATYIDDRYLVVKSPQKAVNLWRLWQSVSKCVGLVENDNNVRVVSRKLSFKQELLQLGF